MLAMAYPKLLSSADIVETAINLIEESGASGLSLRAIAALLGVKAPSLYRYFPHKEALEAAVAQEVLSAILTVLQTVHGNEDPDTRFRETAEAYLGFARERFSLYSLVVQNRLSGAYESKAGQDVWDLLLAVASSVSGRPDDTGATVAMWSFLHGYATLEHSGAFGDSGPQGGLERGLEAFLSDFRRSAPPVRRKAKPRATDLRKKKEPSVAH